MKTPNGDCITWDGAAKLKRSPFHDLKYCVNSYASLSIFDTNFWPTQASSTIVIPFGETGNRIDFIQSILQTKPSLLHRPQVRT